MAARYPKHHRSGSPLLNAINTLLLLLIFAVLGALTYFLFQPEIRKLRHLEHTETELTDQLRQAQTEQLRLEREKHLLESDPLYLENVAREKLDLMKPGETIFRLESRTSPTPSSRPQ